jgi:hypothetical protein
MKEMAFNFTVFVEQLEGHNVAHCLEMGLVAMNEDRNELLTIMSKLIIRQLQFALENGNPSDIYHSAPADVWDRFRTVMSQHRERRSESSMAKTVDIQGWPVPVLCNQFSGMPEPVYA